MLFGLIFSFIFVIVIGFWGLRIIKSSSSLWAVAGEYLFWLMCIFSFLIFAFGTFGEEYSQAIDPIDDQYTAFTSTHIATLIVFLILFWVSAAVLRVNGKKLPPLTFVLCMISMLIGIPISIAVIMQVTSAQIINGYADSSNNNSILCAIYPAMNIVIAVWIICKVISQEAGAASERQYKNKILNFLNRLLRYDNTQPMWILLLLFPVFSIVVLILILFGQEPMSIVNVFTETTTWHFSQQTHPPYLDHSGHYLCTVAACGHPAVVKPARAGKRHGHEIIVNRQLMVANAYEEMLRDYFPKAHQLVRHLYDKLSVFETHHHAAWLGYDIYFDETAGMVFPGESLSVLH